VWPTATLVAPPTTWPPATLAPFFATPRARAWNQRIIVSLSLQMLFAYEGETLLHIAPVSTGAEATPTVAGDFAIYLRRASQRMRGLGYDYDRVPYVQYFYQDYALHAAYWHNSFGRPVSHGCVNLSVPEAEWLYHWARVGTVVQVVP
jgi:lipoprotein-anchoring transpeptidase ErfK/SrfK